ncbi:MAG: glycosyl hydrolase family 95 catalytic domain-containing protein [Massiliimalia sp.]|jgi:alpha-L-fucosidase 2
MQMQAQPQSQSTLYYTTPASSWVEAMPLGNGLLGAMVFSQPEEELVQLNEGTLWSGYPDAWYNRNSLRYLPEARKLLLEGHTAEAQKLIEENMMGRITAAYLPMADLHLNWKLSGTGTVTQYQRFLDMEQGVLFSRFQKEGFSYSTQVFVSYPDQFLFYLMEGEHPFDTEISLDSCIRHQVSVQDGILLLQGVAPSQVSPCAEDASHPFTYGDTPQTSGMRFCTAVQVITDGTVSVNPHTLCVTGANRMELRLTAATSFQGFQTHPFTQGKDETALALKRLRDIENQSVSALLHRHTKDFSQLFDRVSFHLENTSHSQKPLDQRLGTHYDLADTSLIPLAFDYGRYLMISGSRPGGQAMNLQGIWNKEPQPCWRCNYTTNINTQMNYWPAQICRLNECQQPFTQMVQNAAENGKRIAKLQYNCDGWMFHHNLDIWALASIGGGDRAPRECAGWEGSCACLFWPMGGVWLCNNIWQEYAFTMNQDYLKNTAFPLLKGAARFCLDWMIERDGMLTTCPSTSPENVYENELGQVLAADIGTTCDISLIYDLFTHCREACHILGEDPQLEQELDEALRRLPPLKTGPEGQLLEWSKPFEEHDLGHRHVSHLVGLYPGERINEQNNPEMLQACEISLRRRLEHGGGGTGWGLAWLICLYARLKNPEIATEIIQRFLSQSVYDNLMDLHPPLAGAKTKVFQIDGNFGYTAGVGEMLLQSHEGTIRVLPCLPKHWATGQFSGFAARGGFTVDCAWKNGVPHTVTIHASIPGTCKVRWEDQTQTLEFTNESLSKTISFGSLHS